MQGRVDRGKDRGWIGPDIAPVELHELIVTGHYHDFRDLNSDCMRVRLRETTEIGGFDYESHPSSH